MGRKKGKKTGGQKEEGETPQQEEGATAFPPPEQQKKDPGSGDTQQQQKKKKKKPQHESGSGDSAAIQQQQQQQEQPSQVSEQLPQPQQSALPKGQQQKQKSPAPEQAQQAQQPAWQKGQQKQKPPAPEQPQQPAWQKGQQQQKSPAPKQPQQPAWQKGQQQQKSPAPEQPQQPAWQKGQQQQKSPAPEQPQQPAWQKGQQQQKSPAPEQPQQPAWQKGQQQQKSPAPDQPQQPAWQKGQQQQKSPAPEQLQQPAGQRGQASAWQQPASSERQAPAGFGSGRGVQPQRRLAEAAPGVAQSPPGEPCVPEGAAAQRSPKKPTGAVQQYPVKKAGGGLTLSIPLRKNLGTKGRRIRVDTNHLALDLTKLRNRFVQHYDVAFNPDTPKRMLKFAMEEVRKKYFKDRFPAFDGRRNLFSSGELPFRGVLSDTVSVTEDDSNRPREFEVTIQHVAQIDLDDLRTYMQSGRSFCPPQVAIQALDVVLRSATAFRFTSVGRSLFFPPPPGQIISLGDGTELWHGFFQSATIGWKPFLNVDVAHRGFPKEQNVIDTILDVCHVRDSDLNRDLYPNQITDLQKYLKGLKIEYEIPGNPGSKRSYRVNGPVMSPARQKFKLENGQEITVKDYFAREKRVTLRFPNMPCLWVGSPNRPNKIYVPPEFCKVIKGQVRIGKLNELQTSNMVKAAATSTDVRRRKIDDAIRMVNYNQDHCVKEFGISVSGNFERVDGRVLDPPSLEYRSRGQQPTSVKPMRGTWFPKEFLQSNRLLNWIVLCLNDRTRMDEIQNFAEQMQRAGRELGMEIAPPLTPQQMEPPNRGDTRKIEEFLKSMKGRVQLVVVVISDVPRFKDCYSKVKQVAELKVGILTQCVKGKTMFRMNPATCKNILLKVNSKLNGINHSIDKASRPECLKYPVMIVGADVTHPSPDQTDIPSVAAVSASHDPKAFKYNIQIRLQSPRAEIIEDLEAIINIQLNYFYKATSYWPRRIIFYRDGVSEGQFKDVMNRELQALRRACNKVNSDCKPLITFLVVQKRHHTRFFPTRAEDADGKNRNVPPGTIVDTDITHPTELDFYLVSHQSIQGVSRPTKYHVLWNDDDEGMTTDVIEELTYYLCHLFSRCTRSVSYPAPTYNAHLAAFRARAYLEGASVSLNNLENEQRRLKVMQEIISGHPMFFV